MKTKVTYQLDMTDDDHHFGVITFINKNLETEYDCSDIYTKPFKTKRGARNATLRILNDLGLLELAEKAN